MGWGWRSRGRVLAAASLISLNACELAQGPFAAILPPGGSSPDRGEEGTPEEKLPAPPQENFVGRCPKQESKTLAGMKGVWVASVDSYVLDSRDNIVRSFERLPPLGITHVYPVVWNKGAAFYRVSDEVRAILGDNPDLPAKYKGRDVFGEALEEGTRLGLHVIPWFEYGIKVTTDSPVYLQHPDWFMKDVDGNSYEPFDQYGIAYLNPFHPEVRAFLKKLFTDLVVNYPVEAVQFDDHFSFGNRWGYDELTVSLYRQETGKDPPRDPTNAAWLRWRADRFTDFAEEIVDALRAARPGLRISLAPTIYSHAYGRFVQDYWQWAHRGLIDEIVLQNYKYALPNFTAELDQNYVRELSKCFPFGVGIVSGVSTHVNEPDVILDQTKSILSHGLDGVSYFHYPWLVGKRPDNVQKPFIEKLKVLLRDPRWL